MGSKDAVISGTVLISKPLIGDGFFEQSVIYITEHSETGTLGFTLNKPSLIYVQDIIEEIPGEDFLNFGGPVEQDALFFLHDIDTLKDSYPVGGGLYLGGDFDALKDIIKTARDLEVEPFKCRFFLGYSGWSPGQLQEEIEGNTWIVLNPPMDFNPLELDSDAWRDQMKKLGGEYTIWANTPEDPLLN